MESRVGPRHHLGLYWLGELQWDMVLEAPQVRIVWNGLFVTNYHNIRGSFKPASFSLVLTDNNRTPAGLAWARLPTDHTASVRPLLRPLGLCILPDLWLWYFEKCFGDFQPHSLWVVSPYPLPLMSCMLSPWAVSFYAPRLFVRWEHWHSPPTGSPPTCWSQTLIFTFFKCISM